MTDAERTLLNEVLNDFLASGTFPEVRSFRLKHETNRRLLDSLVSAGFLRQTSLPGSNDSLYRLTLSGLQACDSESSRKLVRQLDDILLALKDAYRGAPTKQWSATELAQQLDVPVNAMGRALTLLSELSYWANLQSDPTTGLVSQVQLAEGVLDLDALESASGNGALEPPELLDSLPVVQTIEISGYRPFERFNADFGDLTVLIGANATGKSSLFDFLRFLSFAASNPLPPEIDPRSAGKMLFHSGSTERITFALVADLRQRRPLRYEAEIYGPLGQPSIAREHLATTQPTSSREQSPFVFLDFRAGTGIVRDQVDRRLKRPEWRVPTNELALRRTLDPTLVTASRFQAFLSSWRFYSGFDVSTSAAIRRPAPTEPRPTLAEDGTNLSAVLFSMMTEDQQQWQELETHLRSVIPGFRSLNVKPRGGPGTVIGVWRETGVKDELTLADLSDGTLRLLCWATLCLSGSPPPLICIDEPDLGLHPRVLPVLAGLLRSAASRSQVVVATHSPYLLAQFSLSEVAVMRKEDGRSVFLRPGSSAALRREVEELGGDALAKLHISDELEVRS